MDEIIIEGGKKLKGEVEISGSKNSSLPIMFATLLTDITCTLENVPQLKDIETAIDLLTYLGKKVHRNKNTLVISDNASHKKEFCAPYELVKKMRASFLAAGPLAARHGKAIVSLPGGCAIGVRPVDIHLDGFKQLGMDVKIISGNVHLEVKKTNSKIIKLRYPSVGATENLMLAASYIKEKTTILNSAREPEIVDLANFLNKIGAHIEGAGTDKITIKGTKNLKGATHKIIPDRIEAGTYLIAGAITRGKIIVRNCIPSHLSCLLSKLSMAGVKYKIYHDSIDINSPEKIKPVNITTGPYPGFPTDLQAQWMVLMCTADGKSYIKEKIFENRFMHVPELQRLGADLKIKDDIVWISGNSKLTGTSVMVSDLRAGAALILAGLIAEGKTRVLRVYHLDRGYEHIERKLRKLGANIKRIKK